MITNQNLNSMNPIVEDFLSKRRALQRDEALIQREEHLISLGLVEDRTEERVCYFDEWDGTKACKWDANKQKYYKVVELPVPIEVTDEEYEQILKYAPINEPKKSPVKKPVRGGGSRWGNIIETLAVSMLVLSIVGIIFISFLLGVDTSIIWVVLFAIPLAIISFVITMGFAKIVEAAEDRLNN